MTKNEARAWAYGITIKSLRRKGTALTAADVSKTQKLTPTQLEKCRAAMLELADYLEKRAQRFKGETNAAGSGAHAGAPDAAAQSHPGESDPGVPSGDDGLEDDRDPGGDR